MRSSQSASAGSFPRMIFVSFLSSWSFMSSRCACQKMGQGRFICRTTDDDCGRLAGAHRYRTTMRRKRIAVLFPDRVAQRVLRLIVICHGCQVIAAGAGEFVLGQYIFERKADSGLATLT